jgi:putative NIF3 family GTP cyclohydrolase 1 type 2
MRRRKFVNTAGLGLLAAALPYDQLSSPLPGHLPGGDHPLTAADVNNHLRSLCEVKEPSVDRVIIGDAGTVVKKLGTAWMPYWNTLKEAADAGVNVMVVHEPTFYTHWDLEAYAQHKDYINGPGREKYLELIDRKKGWIEDKGLTIIRCHDVWDKIPEIGIPFALGQALGYTDGDLVRSTTYYNVYQTEPAAAIDVARKIAAALQSADQQGIAFYGDENYLVRSVGVGTGCICDPIEFMNLEPDLFIAIDDTIRTWTQTTFAKDSGRPLVVINHGTSEEYGIRWLSKHLAETYPSYEVRHFNQGCSYKWVTAWMGKSVDALMHKRG